MRRTKHNTGPPLGTRSRIFDHARSTAMPFTVVRREISTKKHAVPVYIWSNMHRRIVFPFVLDHQTGKRDTYVKGREIQKRGYLVAIFTAVRVGLYCSIPISAGVSSILLRSPMGSEHNILHVNRTNFNKRNYFYSITNHGTIMHGNENTILGSHTLIYSQVLSQSRKNKNGILHRYLVLCLPRIHNILQPALITYIEFYKKKLGTRFYENIFRRYISVYFYYISVEVNHFLSLIF